MRLLWRMFVMALALPIAIAASLTALCFAVLLDPVMAAFAGEALRAGAFALFDALLAIDDPGPAVEGATRGIARLAFLVLVVPPAFVALASEAMGARSIVWHAGATGFVTAALPLLSRAQARAPTAGETHIMLVLAGVGATAGLVYWLIAGRWAGAGARPEASAATP